MGSAQDAPRFSLIDGGHYAVPCGASASNNLALAQHASRDLYIQKGELGPLPAMMPLTSLHPECRRYSCNNEGVDTFRVASSCVKGSWMYTKQHSLQMRGAWQR